MTRRKLKIAVSIWSFTPGTGGLQAHARNLCKHLRQRGHDVQVITRSATRIPVFDDYLFFNEPGDDIQVDGIPVRPLRFSRSWRPILWLILKAAARPALGGLAARLYEIVAGKPARAAFAGFDIIHHVGHGRELMGYAAAAAARDLKIPFLVQPTCHPFHAGDTPLDHRLYNKAGRLLVHSRYEADYFHSRRFRSPIDVVWNGIDDRTDGQAERFRKTFGVSGNIILYIGRRDSQKGYFLTLEAFKLIRRQRQDVTLVCLGPGEPTASSPKADAVLDLAFPSEQIKHDALAACACLCVPSEGESFGLVYMEAGRYGKPVIGRNVPVLRELLENGSAGLLLGTPDDKRNWAALRPDELAAGVLKLLSSPQECQRMGVNGRRISEQFLWPRIVEHFEAAYRKELLKSSSEPSIIFASCRT
jgi:glycosyltransferase involved in cell wall biosynthesis